MYYSLPVLIDMHHESLYHAVLCTRQLVMHIVVERLIEARKV